MTSSSADATAAAGGPEPESELQPHAEIARDSNLQANDAEQASGAAAVADEGIALAPAHAESIEDAKSIKAEAQTPAPIDGVAQAESAGDKSSSGAPAEPSNSSTNALPQTSGPQPPESEPQSDVNPIASHPDPESHGHNTLPEADRTTQSEAKQETPPPATAGSQTVAPVSTPPNLPQAFTAQIESAVKKEEPEAANEGANVAGMDSGQNYDELSRFAASRWTARPFTPNFSNLASMISHKTPEQSHARPATVTPSQVHISSMNQGLLNQAEMLNNGDMGTESRQSLESFASIQFADSTFQMTTYTVIIGRDRAAIKQAQKNEKRAEMHKRQCEENLRLGIAPPTPLNQNNSKFSKSYVSEAGGILGPESSEDGEDDEPPAKRRKTSSAESSVHGQEPAEDQAKNDREYVSHTPGAVAVDLASLRPRPDYVAFVGIHSPGPNIAKKSKGISRQHLKIAYNKKKGVFEAIPMHSNGFFHQENHRGPGSTVILRSGDRLQIKDIAFRFVINGVSTGNTGAEEFDKKISKGKIVKGAKEMSFDFTAHGNGQMQDTSDELSDVDDEDVDNMEKSLLGESALAKASQEPEDEIMEDAPDLERPENENRIPVPLGQPDLDPSLMPEIPKKRGPGRPPKNGIMSKRQQRELKKAQQELAKQQAAQAPPVEPPTKRKVGRPRKHPLPEGEASAEKRKYKPRKPREDGAEGSDAERRAKEKKSKLTRPKSPPLELRREDYTEQDLQKPNKNYGVLIDEMLTAAPEGLTLKQIYKRISQKYPWFYFHTETKGWESSVRHNLIGNEAFKKEEATNLWKRVPGVELDAGKRRKATSPDRNLAAQAYNAHAYPYKQGQQHMAHAPHGFAAGQQLPQGYQMPAYNPQHAGQGARPVQQHYGHSAPPHPNTALPQAGQQPVAAQQPTHPQHIPPAAGQPAGTAPYATSYPYPPQARANTLVKTEDGTAGQPSAQTVPAAPVASPAIAAAAAAHPVQSPQQPQQPSPAQASPAATPSKPGQPLIEPTMITRLNHLRNSLTEGLKRANTPHAQDIVWSAIDRIVGLKKEPSGHNNSLEATCYNGMTNLIERTAAQIRGTPPPDGTNPSAFLTLLHPDTSKHIEGLRNQCVSAIKARLPEGDAIALVHSAIIRNLGLADESRLAGKSQSYDHLEKAIIKNVSTVLTQMSGAFKGTSERGSSAGPRASPAARLSATPQASTPAPAQPSTQATMQAPSQSPAPAPAPAPAVTAASAPAPAPAPSQTTAQPAPQTAPQIAPQASSTTLVQTHTQATPQAPVSAPPSASPSVPKPAEQASAPAPATQPASTTSSAMSPPAPPAAAPSATPQTSQSPAPAAQGGTTSSTASPAATAPQATPSAPAPSAPASSAPAPDQSSEAQQVAVPAQEKPTEQSPPAPPPSSS